MDVAKFKSRLGRLYIETFLNVLRKRGSLQYIGRSGFASSATVARAAPTISMSGTELFVRTGLWRIGLVVPCPLAVFISREIESRQGI
jgi:hypothetical protein